MVLPSGRVFYTQERQVRMDLVTTVAGPTWPTASDFSKIILGHRMTANGTTATSYCAAWNSACGP
jgi:hypothetical protein